MHSWWISTGPSDECGRAKWTAIQNDKRFPALLKLLQDLGFGSPDMSKPDWLATYMTCCGGDLNLHHYRAWAAAAGYYFSHWIEVGQTAPVRKHFPNAVFSEYGAAVAGGPALAVPSSTGFDADNVSCPPASDTPSDNNGDTNSSRVALPGGTQSPEFYFDISSALAKTLKHSYGVNDYPITAFNAARHAVNSLRSKILAAARLRLPQPVKPGSEYYRDLNYRTVPYIPYKSYKNSKTNASDYYQEFILHAGLMGVDRFLMWNTHAVGNDNIDASRSFDELEQLLAVSERQRRASPNTHRQACLISRQLPSSVSDLILTPSMFVRQGGGDSANRLGRV